jgi:hypothetical protein
MRIPSPPKPVEKPKEPVPPKPVVHRKREIAPRRPAKIEQQIYGRAFKGCGEKDEYDMMTKLGEGTFGSALSSLGSEILFTHGVVRFIRRSIGQLEGLLLSSGS